MKKIILLSLLLTISIFVLFLGINPMKGNEISFKPQINVINLVDKSNAWGFGNGRVWKTDHLSHWQEVTPKQIKENTRAIQSKIKNDSSNAKENLKFKLYRLVESYAVIDKGHVVIISFQENENDNIKLVTYKTDNGGISWSESILERKTKENIFGTQINMINQNQGWLLVEPEHGMSSHPGELYMTIDGGASWNPVKGKDGEFSIPSTGKMKFITDKEGWFIGWENYASGPQGVLYHTMNGGEDWNKVSLPFPNYLQDGVIDVTETPYFDSSYNDGVVAVTYVPNSHQAKEYKSLLYNTRNGGKTWNDIEPPLPPGQFSFINSKEGWFWVYEEGTIGKNEFPLYHTADGGRTWNAIANDTNIQKLISLGAKLNDFKFLTKDLGYLHFTYSNMITNTIQQDFLITTNGGETWDEIHFNLTD